jgi:hypothetical protein
MANQNRNAVIGECLKTLENYYTVELDKYGTNDVWMRTLLLTQQSAITSALTKLKGSN